MCRRNANRPEEYAMVDKACELLRQVCEYERYVKDLAIMLAKGEVQAVAKHNVPYPADWVWDRIRDMINAGRGIKVERE